VTEKKSFVTWTPAAQLDDSDLGQEFRKDDDPEQEQAGQFYWFAQVEFFTQKVASFHRKLEAEFSVRRLGHLQLVSTCE
jgi:hypothetical protein